MDAFTLSPPSAFTDLDEFEQAWPPYMMTTAGFTAVRDVSAAQTTTAGWEPAVENWSNFRGFALAITVT